MMNSDREAGVMDPNPVSVELEQLALLRPKDSELLKRAANEIELMKIQAEYWRLKYVVCKRPVKAPVHQFTMKKDA